MNKWSILFCFIIIFYTKSSAQWIKYTWPIEAFNICFPDSLNGIIYGNNGVGLTSDGGDTWLINKNYYFDNYQIYFVTKEIGFLFSMEFNAKVYKTEDGGSSWTEVFSNSSFIFNDMYFFNDSTGFAVGTNGAIYFTSDGGIRWYNKSISSESGTNFMLIYFVDSLNGWMYGLTTNIMNGVKLTTNDGGNTWLKESDSSPIVEKHFINKKIGFGRANSTTLLNSKLYKTTNGGFTWNTLAPVFQNSEGEIYSIYFLNDSVGYASGYIVHSSLGYGAIFKTINSGNNWDMIYQDSIWSSIDKLYFINEKNGWAYNSSLGWLETSNGGITYIKGNKNNSEPIDFLFTQNYPNPFNPTTEIEYSLPKTALVEIKVYDILGREIATLVNEEKPAGSYEVKFDGSKYTSGIYFYRMQAGSYIAVKKMILLR